MSGGSYNYIYSKLLDECEGCMYDYEMNDFVKDFVMVLKALEWWQSSDYSEDSYRETLKSFKAKWFNGDREVRLKEYIDREISDTQKRLYDLIGVKTNE